MSKTPIVVTGLGATTPLGGDVASTWEALLAGRSGVSRIEQDWADELAVQIAAQRRGRSRPRCWSGSRPAGSTARPSSA